MNSMSDLCKWLHEQLQRLPIVAFPFDLGDLPDNGIYFFYEKGEIWGHAGKQPRIVRIGSHRGQGNLRSRISETYLLDEGRLAFTEHKPKPADRSIFRKNVGRALLNKSRDDYLEVWDVDFTLRRNRDSFQHRRHIGRERDIEAAISTMLREKFSFRFAIVEDKTERSHLEKRLIGTVAKCPVCRASTTWLGKHSPEPKISGGKLWQVQHLRASGLSSRDKEAVLEAIGRMLGAAGDTAEPPPVLEPPLALTTDRAVVFQRIGEVEVGLRRHIFRTLRAAHGDRWFHRGLPEHVRRAIDKKMARQRKKLPFKEFTPEEKLGFTNMRHLKDIVLSRHNWPSFEPACRSRKNVEAQFDDLIELRNPLAHSGWPDDVFRHKGMGALIWFERCLGLRPYEDDDTGETEKGNAS